MQRKNRSEGNKKARKAEKKKKNKKTKAVTKGQKRKQGESSSSVHLSNSKSKMRKMGAKYRGLQH